MPTYQSSNTVAGNMAGRDNITNNNYTNSTTHSPFAKLYQDLRKSNSSDPHIFEMSEMLRHYANTSSGADVRGLAAKLTESGRADFIESAEQLKQFASMKIMRWETSEVAQEIFTQILTMLWSNFSMKVRPAIQAGAIRDSVDLLIQEQVINPTYAILGDNDLKINQVDLLGFLFFLGGNCHIRWDKC